LSVEEPELRALVADLVGRAADSGGSANPTAVWSGLQDAGLVGVGTPEHRGGSGGSLRQLGVVVAELARHAVSTPIIEVATAGWALSHAMAPDESSSTGVAPLGVLTADPRGRLSGTLPAVAWAGALDRLLVRSTDGAGWSIELRHPAVTLIPGANLAGERRDQVSFDGVPADRVEPVPDGIAVRNRLAALWSWALRGAGGGAYDFTRSYVSSREQFGAPLTAIPAVTSALARMRIRLTEMDIALSRLYLEAAAVAGGAAAAGAAVDVARFTTASAAGELAQTAHQLHGAIGVTEEYPLHQFTRRLWAWRDELGSEHDAARALGERAADANEAELWEWLTAAHRRD
jgi:acyl-CoA dehydrogenase